MIVVIRKVKNLLIKSLCRRERKLTWDWSLSCIGGTFVRGIQGLRLLPFCVSVIPCGFRILYFRPAEREKAESRKPQPLLKKSPDEKWYRSLLLLPFWQEQAIWPHLDTRGESGNTDSCSAAAATTTPRWDSMTLW